jgi:drug/metabolite transporter (DMT)-like permease
MNGRKWVGMLIGFIGIIPVLAIQKGSGELLTGFFNLTLPELAMMGASICTVYGWVLLRLVVKDSTISPFMANGLSMFVGGLMALGHSYLFESWTPFPVAATSVKPFVTGLLIMTFISNIVCYNIYGMMLRKYTATFLSFMGVLSPIFASFISRLFLGEPLSPVIFLSTAIVSLGLWLIYSAELRQGYIRKDEPAKIEPATA